MIRELTIEITNFCEHNCQYCSSNSYPTSKSRLPIETIELFLFGKMFDRINISGGEPLSHPNFYNILQLCKKHASDVAIYTNAITHLIYNAQVIDGVYLEANLTVLPEVDKVHLLRRVRQGKEIDRPEVSLSRNFSEDCDCDHHILRTDGKLYKTPCSKYQEEDE